MKTQLNIFVNLLNFVTETDYTAIADPSWPSYSQLKTMTEIPTQVRTELEAMVAQTQQDLKQTDTFCALAFYGAEYCMFTPFNILRCCGSEPHHLPNIRSEMLNQQRPDKCYNNCFKLEDAGEKSLRQIMNQTLDAALDRDISLIYKDAALGDYTPLIYKIEPDNTCNATCVTCGSGNSSAWASLERKHGVTPAPRFQMTPTQQGIVNGEQLYAINYRDAKMINFLGGETTLNKSSFQILEFLANAENFDCIVSFTTHGNFTFTKDQQTLLKKFKNLQFNFSIDGVGPVFEYLRFPLKWDKLQQNIQWCRDLKIDISVNITWSNLNLMYHDELVSWLTSQQLAYRSSQATNHKIQSNQRHYHTSSLSQRVKDEIKKRNHGTLVHALLADHNDDHDFWYYQFLQDLVIQDQWKGIKLQDYLGDFFELVQEDIQQLKTLPKTYLLRTN